MPNIEDPWVNLQIDSRVVSIHLTDYTYQYQMNDENNKPQLLSIALQEFKTASRYHPKSSIKLVSVTLTKPENGITLSDFVRGKETELRELRKPQTESTKPARRK